jgi:urease accessory protein
MSRLNQVLKLGALLFLVMAATAEAHTGTGAIGGFISGFEHPIFGLDHLVAMVAVGLWGAFLGAPAIWVLPIVFPLVMAFGGVLGILGVPLPHVETWIAMSAIVLGLSVFAAFRPPLWIAAVIVGAFAIFHGHAHGNELPNAADPLAYSIGFVLATGLLHLCGIALGLLIGLRGGQYLVRACGAIVAVVGLAFLTGYA